MAAVTGSDRCDEKWASRPRALIVAVSVMAAASCSGTAASEAPPSTVATTTVEVPVPATAGPTEGGLLAPHSGDRLVASGCPDGGEMLDWDDDGWGDCVTLGAPARPSQPVSGS